MKQHSVATTETKEDTNEKEIWKDSKKDKKKKNEDTTLTYGIKDLIDNLKIEDI